MKWRHRVVIVAGQSNATGVFSNPVHLEDDPADAEIDLCWSHATESDGVVALQPQRMRELSERTVLMSTHGFGPEITLARALHARREPNERVLIVKCSANGTSLQHDWNPPRGACYQRLLDLVRSARDHVAVGGGSFEIDAILWVQGESDMEEYSREYAANLDAFVSALRRDLRVPRLPVLVSRLNAPVAAEPNRSTVRAAQVAFADGDADATWIDTDDLPLGRDGIHLLPDGLKTLGTRAAEQVFLMRDRAR